MTTALKFQSELGRRIDALHSKRVAELVNGVSPDVYVTHVAYLRALRDVATMLKEVGEYIQHDHG